MIFFLILALFKQDKLFFQQLFWISFKEHYKKVETKHHVGCIMEHNNPYGGLTLFLYHLFYQKCSQNSLFNHASRTYSV